MKFIFTPLFYSIGNASEEILWAHAYALKKKFSLNIIKPYSWTECLGYKICNKEFFNLSFSINKSKFNNIHINLIINCIFFLKRFIHLFFKKINGVGLKEDWRFPRIGYSQIWPPHHQVPYSLDLYKNNPILDVIHYVPPPILDPQIEEECKKLLKVFGVDAVTRYVCIHVRDPGYHGDGNRRNYRNADINNYLDGIRYLIKKGFIVFRMGDNKMKPLLFQHPKFVDYPFTLLKSEAMDLFLIKNCSFYIGMQSGILDTAILFSKPILTLNIIDWFFAFPFKRNDRGVMKSIKFKNNNKQINSCERFLLPFKYTNSFSIVDEDIEFIENSQEQILQSIKYFVLEFESNFKIPPTDEMIKSKNLFLENSFRIMNSKDDSFMTLSRQQLARATLKNLSSRGFLYDQ